MAFGEKCGSTSSNWRSRLKTRRNSLRCANRGGAARYLEVLTNETNYFSAELGLAQAQSNELVALVRIYRNLGGGWQQ
jgi:outer membrane protein TolC